MFLLLAAPVGADARRSSAALPLEAPRPSVPMRDVVLEEPAAAGARISATATPQRYPLNDGSGATIEVAITAACAATCEVKDPQHVADTIGSFLHGDEVDLLEVQVDTAFELGLDCGYGAEACYFTGKNKIVIGGYREADGDGATFEFVLAHEYGHHVAQHRDLPAPFGLAVDWGTLRWASLEDVCQGDRRGRLHPGNEGTRYFQNPGEAFAESFAHLHFPELAVVWRFSPALRPNARSLQAIEEDTLTPWQGRRSFVLSGRAPARGKGAAVESLPTPLDGLVTLRPVGLRRHGYELVLRSRAGRFLRSSRHGFDPHRRLDYPVCGQSRLRLLVHSRGDRHAPYRLLIQRP